MPAKPTKTGSRKQVHSKIDSSTQASVPVGISDFLNRISDVFGISFKEDVSDLRFTLMEDLIFSDIDQVFRRIRMISLLTEFCALAEQETSITSEIRHHARDLQNKLLFSLSSREVAESKSVLLKASELWKDRKKRPELENKKENPVQFIRRVYKSVLDIIAKDDLRRLDFQLYTALNSWAWRNSLPPDFYIPTRAEVNSRKLADAGLLSDELGKEAREMLRLTDIRRKRDIRRHRQPK